MNDEAAELVTEPEPLLPVRMLNEYVYCPRLFYLEWVQGEWSDNADTLDGQRVHRRVDIPSAKPLPAADRARDRAPVVSADTADAPADLADALPERLLTARSVDLADAELGLIARIDLVEAEGDEATPVDYKRSQRPALPEGAYEPERVQICAQGLLLRAHGYRSERGVLYFAGSRERVDIVFDERLIARTLEMRDAARQAAKQPIPPPPLVDSPKCPRCSLVGICLPDEQNAVLGRGEKLRPLAAPRHDALPLHVQEPGAVLSKQGSELVVKRKGGEPVHTRLIDVSRINLHGAAHATLPALRAAIDHGIPIGLFTFGGWYCGRIHGHEHKNVLLRRAQFAHAADPARALALARRFVRCKIRNCRVFLRRNHQSLDRRIVKDLRVAADRAVRAQSMEELLGVEGYAARLYFEHFGGMLRKDLPFVFTTRNRRPPRDPVNAMLSFAYAMLVSECTAALSIIGFDPYMGYLHQVHYGRPSLALDLMEEFRPIIADSAVITAINTGVVSHEDFVVGGTAVAIKQAARKRFIQGLERRLDELITHPVFGYRISYRRALDVQARLLGRYLMGEIAEYPEFLVR